MSSYTRLPANRLPKSVGVDCADGRRKSDGQEGCLCYGPYIKLEPGSYTGGFYLRRVPVEQTGDIEIDVSAQQGERVFATKSVPIKQLFTSVDGLVSIDFVVDTAHHDFELRLRVPTHSHVEIAEAVIFRRDLQDWGHV